MTPEVITIDDTPPSSPVNSAESGSDIETLDLTIDDSSDISCTNNSLINKTYPWEKKRNKTTKTMNLSLVDQIIDDSEVTCELVNSTKPKRNVTSNTAKTISNTQNNQINICNYMSKCHFSCFYPCNGYRYGCKPENVHMGNYSFPVYENRTCLTSFPYPPPLIKKLPNIYAKNSIPNTKISENVKYVQPSMMPSSFCTFPEDYHSQPKPEYIDINNLMNYSSNDKSSLNGLTFDKKQQTTEDDTRSTTLKNNKSCIKNSVPLFLKRHRSVNTIPNNFNKMKVVDLSSDNLNEQKNINNIPIEPNQELKDDDSDVVYVGAYARDPIYPELQPTIYKLPYMEINEQNQQNLQSIVVESSSSSDSNTVNEKSEEKDIEVDSTGVKGKRKRKPLVTVPRRNPKRQVQIEKDYLKLLDNVICESKKEIKVRKTKKTNKSYSLDEKKNGDTFRRTANCGAVYRPPSPLRKHHFRQWPVSGMHERPEYNPVSGKLEPFDSIIRNISAKYHHQPNHSDYTILNKDEETREANKSLSALCHEMFHHVFAYGATVRNMQKEKNREENDVEKNNFMKDLALDSICNPLNLTVPKKDSLDNEKDSKNQDELLTLKELMKNSLLLYCLTNHDVDRDNLSKYIQTIDPDELIDWSNKEFNLTN